MTTTTTTATTEDELGPPTAAENLCVIAGGFSTEEEARQEGCEWLLAHTIEAAKAIHKRRPSKRPRMRGL